MKYFFLKLIPPRPDFMGTMTDGEKELMQAHAAYWKGFAEKGWAVAYGPVAGRRAGLEPASGLCRTMSIPGRLPMPIRPSRRTSDFNAIFTPCRR